MNDTLDKADTSVSPRLDFPEDWNPKQVSFHPAFLLGGWLFLFAAVALPVTTYLHPNPPAGFDKLWGVPIALAILGAILVPVGYYLRAAYKKYVFSFLNSVAELGKSRHGIELTSDQVVSLIGYGQSVGFAGSSVNVNFEGKRVTVRLDYLVEGKDIRFFFAGTNEELTTVSDTSSVFYVSAAQNSSAKSTIDLPEGYGRELLGVPLTFATVIVLSAFLVFLTLTPTLMLPTPEGASHFSFSFSGFMIMAGITAVLAGIGLAFTIPRAKKAEAQVVAGRAALVTGVESNYGIKLNEEEAWLLYAGRPVTIVSDNERISTRLSVLPGAKDARLVYDNTDIELPLAAKV